MLHFDRLFEEPTQSYFLFGPRGTGKSTLVKRAHPNALLVNLLDPEQSRNYIANPERLYQLIEGNPEKRTIILDEVQKAPELLSIVHDLIEAKLGKQFIMTGSSARKLKRTSANLLGGRALKKSLHPFMAAEIKDKFNLMTALETGMLPIAFAADDPQATLQAYINLYLKEEIQAEGLVRNIGNFSRFLEAICFSHASLLNITNVARESGVKRKTVENYVEILEDLLLAHRLQVFTRRAQRELIAHPKLYLFDSGVFQALRPKGPFDSINQLSGIVLEGLIAQHLRAWNEYSAQEHFLGYWRTKSGIEVDFIIYGPLGLWAIEVKYSNKIDARDLKGLKTFQKDYPSVIPILLYCGNEIIKIDGILCLPCDKFLLQLIPNESLWR